MINIHANDFSIKIADDGKPQVTLEELQKAYTLYVLDVFKGMQSGASRVLGINRRTMYRKLKEWDISIETVERLSHKK